MGSLYIPSGNRSPIFSISSLVDMCLLNIWTVSSKPFLYLVGTFTLCFFFCRKTQLLKAWVNNTFIYNLKKPSHTSWTTGNPKMFFRFLIIIIIIALISGNKISVFWKMLKKLREKDIVLAIYNLRKFWKIVKKPCYLCMHWAVALLHMLFYKQ